MANKKDNAAKAQAAQTNESAAPHFEIIEYHSSKSGKVCKVLVGDTKDYSPKLKKIATFAANLYGSECVPAQPTERVKGWFVTERNEEQIAEFMADPDNFTPQPKKLGKKKEKKEKDMTKKELLEALAEARKMIAQVKGEESKLTAN